MTALRALIVDDEPLARDTLRGLLQADAEVAVAGECGNGAAAIATIRAERPDIVFLDVQMPDMNGFEVLEQVVSEHVPVVVFVTAYDRYAIQAFDVHAVDYLLKPFDDARFTRALRRAKRAFLARRSEGDARLLSLLDRHSAPAGPAPLLRLAIPSRTGLVFLRTADVDWIEAADYYVQIHVGTKVHLLREPLTSLEGRLDAREFVRVHRSAIVNVDRIRELRPGPQGRDIVVLQDGTELRVSRSHRRDLQERLR